MLCSVGDGRARIGGSLTSGCNSTIVKTTADESRLSSIVSYLTSPTVSEICSCSALHFRTSVLTAIVGLIATVEAQGVKTY